MLINKVEAGIKNLPANKSPGIVPWKGQFHRGIFTIIHRRNNTYPLQTIQKNPREHLQAFL